MDFILFEKDWAKYPTAIADTNTKNKSFLRLALVYRSMGIRNHAFILALINPRLVGVDPYSEDLTAEQIAWIVAECYQNPWYFLREVARVPAQAGQVPVYVEANRGIIALWWLFFNHIVLTLIMPRQTGKSLGVDLLDSGLLNIWLRDTRINLMTKDDKVRRENIERIKDIIRTLPWYINQRTKKDIDNGEEITIRALGNTYKSHVARSNERDAYNLGRGMSSSIMRIDEGPFQTWFRAALGAALAAGGAHMEKADQAGAPWGITYTTTAGKLNDPDGAYFHEEIYSAGAPMTEHFYDCEDLPRLREVIRNNTRSKYDVMVTCVYSHRQLGKTDEWMFERLKLNKQKGDDANRDMFNFWTSGTATNPIDSRILKRMMDSKRPAVDTEISDAGFMLHWYIDPSNAEQYMESTTCIMGSDPSEGAGRDDWTIYIIDAEKMCTIAEGTFNHLNIISVSQFIASILVRFRKLVFIPERKSQGPAMLDQITLILLANRINPFKRIFNWFVQELVPNSQSYRSFVNMPDTSPSVPLLVHAQRATFGFATSGSGKQSRSSLYGNLIRASECAPDTMYSHKLIEQIGCLVSKDNVIDHPPGGHDDMVIAWLLVHWFIYNAKNLSIYGIDSSRLMTMIERIDAVVMTAKEEREYYHQMRVREEIDQISTKMSEETDEFILTSYENRLRVLNSMLVLQEGEHFSLDSLLSDLKKKRRMRSYSSRSR